MYRRDTSQKRIPESGGVKRNVLDVSVRVGGSRALMTPSPRWETTVTTSTVQDPLTLHPPKFDRRFFSRSVLTRTIVCSRIRPISVVVYVSDGNGILTSQVLVLTKANDGYRRRSCATSPSSCGRSHVSIGNSLHNRVPSLGYIHLDRRQMFSSDVQVFGFSLAYL
jgi:hypothetical protein